MSALAEHATNISAMRRHLGPISCAIALGIVAVSVAPATSSAQAAAPGEPCQGMRSISETTLSSGLAGSPLGDGSCWVEQPYPFGDQGEAVTDASCEPGVSAVAQQVIESCYLTVTSMAFRAWNQGLAATEPTLSSSAASNPFGVWQFNGVSWSPSFEFPGSKTCSGHTVVWAGKLDYWLIGSEGPPAPAWSNICRFDGEHNEWEPLELPEAVRKTGPPPSKTEEEEGKVPKPAGEITSASCFAWNNCWFFGTHGVVVHWNGQVLSNASPDPSQQSLLGEYTDAVTRQGLTGEDFGVAVARTNEEANSREPLQTLTGGAPPAQLYGSSGGAFSALAFTPFTEPLTGDPFRTDLVAVDLDSAGQGWVAGNPTSRQGAESQPPPSPLEPVSSTGEASACTGPPAERFTGGSSGSPAFRWSSISVIPTTGEALAGGEMTPAAALSGAPNEDGAPEPVITQANCQGTTTLTRFRIEDPTSTGNEAPPDRTGRVSTIAANATNDAWAATTHGELVNNQFEPPHLYRLTDGQPPEAPGETYPPTEPQRQKEEEGEPDPVTFVLEPPPPSPAPEPPATVTKSKAVKLPAAVYDVKAKLHTATHNGHVTLSLYLTFKLRRSVTIGAHALRHGKVVSVAKPRHFAGRSGVLILILNRKHWPTSVKFVS
jgi:hypothetical protein